MNKNTLLSALLAIIFIAQNSSAQDEKPEKKLPKSGSLSISSSGTSASKNFPDPWGADNVVDSNSAPITGSVSKISPTNWVAKVFNNSDDTYSVSLAVYQYDRRNTKIKSDSFSYTLRPRESAERPISTSMNTEQCELDLLSWNKKESAKK